jgi:glycolate oxidase FAD binding subunit
VSPPEILDPGGVDELAEILREASEKGRAVSVTGGGTHSGYGSPEPPEVGVSTERMSGIIDWQPDDLTIVVEAGARVAGIEEQLAARNQSMVFPEHPGNATVGGCLAAGVSSLRRGRLYPTRERVLETVAVTGDGRVVRSGGRVVKNVTGYDLSRLHVGAFGSLGVIYSVCLKLWPVPPAAATLERESPMDAMRVMTRPLAVLEERGRTRLYAAGTEAEIDALVAGAGSGSPGLDWPADPVGSWRWSLRVPPALTSDGVSRLPEGWDYLAVHGVGEVRAASPSPDGAHELRSWAESRGGRLVVVERPSGAPEFDPWGAPPPALDLQRELIARFDPMRVLNRGRLPGGL